MFPSSSPLLPSVNRREFIFDMLKAPAGLALLSLAFAPAEALAASVKKQYTVQEIIDIILKEGQLTPLKETVDTIKFGSADQQVTGIVTTMFPTITVIEEAARRHANFIIAHEPSYYNHRDETAWLKDNEVLREKQALLEKNNMVIWRFHDYCHALRPDAIGYGVARKAGWRSYYKTGQRMLTIPPVSLRELVQHLKSTLGVQHLRVIGDLQQSCERILLMPGASGGQRQITMSGAEKPDVMIAGEVSEWETAEYIRDGRLLGKKTALIVLGHAVSEEPGMEWVAEWLQPKLPGMPITHLASGDPFTWM